MKLLKNIFFLIVVLFLLSSLIKNFFDYRKNLQFYQSFQEEYETEKKKNTTLKTQVLKETDPREVEKTIRNKLNLGKENETVIILPEPTPTPTIFTPTSGPVYRQWLEIFFSQENTP